MCNAIGAVTFSTISMVVGDGVLAVVVVVVVEMRMRILPSKQGGITSKSHDY